MLMEMKHKVLAGSEQFRFNDNPLQTTVKDFWAWSMSRLIADGPRGDLAEFIVNTALGIDTTEPKHGWGECDIIYDGIRIEVKCSSLLQAWERETIPKPVFSIAKRIGCDVEETDTGYRYIGRSIDDKPERRSECYIFCLFKETDRAKADPLQLEQWDFYIVPTKTIDEKLGSQRSITIKGIERLGATPIGFDNIKSTIDAIFPNR